MYPNKNESKIYELEQLSGDFLYVAGSDLYNRLNQPSQHMPYHLATHLEHLDLVGYKRFYDGPRVTALKRFTGGCQNLISHRIDIRDENNIRTISARRVRLPEIIDRQLQDLWLYAILRPNLKRRYQVGVVDGPESAFLMTFLKKSGRVRFLIYYDIDYYPGQNPKWARILSWRESICCHTADAVVSVSRPLATLRGHEGAKLTVVIPNGVDFKHFNSAYLKHIEHPPTLIYAGSLDSRWGVDLSIRSMPLIRKLIPAIRLIIAGRGPAEQELRKKAVDLCVSDCIDFLGFIPHSELPTYFAQADISIATSRNDAFRQYASPLKIVEYMAAGLPVICSGGGEAEQMIDESGAGTNIPFEPEAFTKAVYSFWNSPGALSTLREAAVNYARGRSWEQMGVQMAQLISSITGTANYPPTTITSMDRKGVV